MMQFAVLTIFLVTIYGTTLTVATICEPNSRFTIDCNECFCSNEGTEYSCTRKLCQGQKPPKYTYDDQDYVLPKRDRLLYVNDEISAEENDGYQNDIPKNIDWDDNEVNNIDPVDEDDNAGDENSIDIDEEIPDDYKYRRPLSI